MIQRTKHLLQSIKNGDRDLLRWLCLFMELLLLPAIFLCLATSGTPAHAANGNEYEGLWLTSDKKYVISVSRCGSTLCGNIYWADPTISPLDVKSHDPEQRQTPLCGLNVLQGFKQIDDRHWTGGTIYRTETGDTYHATIEILPSGNVLLRGYILAPLFGQSDVLTPVSVRDYPQCKAPGFNLKHPHDHRRIDQSVKN
jgi:uncharacterized protein (DUF2147 family)